MGAEPEDHLKMSTIGKKRLMLSLGTWKLDFVRKEETCHGSQGKMFRLTAVRAERPVLVPDLFQTNLLWRNLYNQPPRDLDQMKLEGSDFEIGSLVGRRKSCIFVGWKLEPAFRAFVASDMDFSRFSRMRILIRSCTM